MLRHADADLGALVTASVPPCDLSKISIFQCHLATYHGQARPKDMNTGIFMVSQKYVVFQWCCDIPMHSLQVNTANDQKAAMPIASKQHVFSILFFFFGFKRRLVQTIPRLNAQLLQTTWSQTEVQFQQDLLKLQNWAGQYALFSQQQAMVFFLCSI